MSGFNTDLVTGFASLLAANVAGITWHSDGTAYTAGETGVFIAKMPATPDRCVVLTPYPLGDDPTLSDSSTGLQIRSRGIPDDPRDVLDLDDAITDFLLGYFPLDLDTGITVTTLVRASAVSLGQDDLKRWEWASNYALALHRPSMHRT